MTVSRAAAFALGLYFGLLFLQGLGLAIIPVLFTIVALVVAVLWFIVAARGS